MFDEEMLRQARELFADLEREKLMIATAESCTGGLIAALLTEIAGSSAFVERGYVTYSNEAKAECLGVPADLIARDGAVSETVARAMAAGALARSRAGLAVAVTGIAGPGGGTAEKPVGLVHVAAQRRGRDGLHERLELGDSGRSAIRLETVRRALALAHKAISN